MSHEATNWAAELKGISPMAKLVLLRLADRADESGICYPGQRRLAAECCITERTVRNALAELIFRSVVIIQAPSTPRGETTRYLLTFATPEPRSGGEPHSGEEQRSQKGGTTFRPPRNHVPVTPEPRSAEPSENHHSTLREPSGGETSSTPECPPDAPEPTSATNTPTAKQNPATVTRNLTAEPLDHHFDAFVREYPRKVRSDKHATIRKTWLRMVTTPEIGTAILADVRFRKTTENWKRNRGQYVPDAGKYLADRKWLDPAAVIERLTHEIDRHPGNPDSIYHDPSASQAIVENFKAKKARLRELQRGQS
jgi:hypothetical protein